MSPNQTQTHITLSIDCQNEILPIYYTECVTAVFWSIHCGKRESVGNSDICGIKWLLTNEQSRNDKNLEKTMGRTVDRIVKTNIVGQNGFRRRSCIERQECCIIFFTKETTLKFHHLSILESRFAFI